MITLDEFLKRWPGRVEKTTAEEIQLFIDTVLDRSDDYERMVAKLPAPAANSNPFSQQHI